MIDLTPIINAVIAILGAVATCYIVPWIKEHTTAKERENLLFWAEIAVKSAQQLYYQLDGRARKEHAREILRQHGFDVDDPSVDAALEAEVLKLHQALEVTK